MMSFLSQTLRYTFSFRRRCRSYKCLEKGLLFSFANKITACCSLFLFFPFWGWHLFQILWDPHILICRHINFFCVIVHNLWMDIAFLFQTLWGPTIFEDPFTFLPSFCEWHFSFTDRHWKHKTYWRQTEISLKATFEQYILKTFQVFLSSSTIRYQGLAVFTQELKTGSE